MTKLSSSFMIGDVDANGHGRYDTILMKVSIKNQDNLIEFENELEYAERLIKEKFDIDLSSWFVKYEDNIIPACDVKKLETLNIKFYNQDIDDEDGSLYIYMAEDYFNIWKQLIETVNNNIKIEKVEFPSFYGKCSGYGLYIL